MPSHTGSALTPFAVGLPFLGLFVALLCVSRASLKLVLKLELGPEYVTARAPSGDILADTRSNNLTLQRCTYVRPGRAGGWVRPGWRLLYPGGDRLIGILWPQDVFQNVGRDPRLPEFELDRAQFAALEAAVDALEPGAFNPG